MGNPSVRVDTPLTGGYLLIVLAEPRSAEHKLAILKRLTKGLSCWNFEESGVEIATELNAIVNQNIEGEEGKNGEQLFQYASDHLVAEILVNPQHSTLVQCVRNLLASFTKYRCIIHAGYSFTENGSWILQDGSFSVADFLDAYKTAEAQRTVRLHENQIRTELHCSGDGDWVQASRVKDTRFVLNPQEKIIENESIESTVRWLCDKIEVVELDTLLEGSQVVGNIRFSRPTLYVFPAGQGDSALFGINGFNMLIDGGTGRNSCFWGFARHLDRLDAVLLTRLNSTNLEGVASFLKRKTMSSLYPQIGHFFCNFKTRKQVSSPSVDVKKDVLSISIIDTAQSIISDLKQLQLRPHLCYRNINLEPINLYHKVGHGKLDMYVLNPSKDSKDVKDFLSKWNEGDQKLFNTSKEIQFPLPNIISICTLLVWQPANPNTTITRIFFPGSSPQNKIFEALERVRHLEFLKHPSCSIKSMNSSTSVTIKSQTTKKTVLEKMIPGETKTVKTMENLEVSTTASNAVIQTAIIPTVPKEGAPKPKTPTESEKLKTNIKTVVKETSVKSKIDHKYSTITAKVNSNKIVQKNTTMKKPLKLSSKSPPTDKSSPTTPSENPEKTTKPTKQIIKPKATPSSLKSPTSTPTKSKKEEANRKVLVTSRTNSGLRRTQTTKKETNPLNIKNNDLRKPDIKKDSNVVYKSSLISGNKDKSGEEEDILIIEKVAITPEKLLTPDGKKIIANELDGILTAAKDIVTKEKCAEKLSDSGSTTAPTMPEDEKITESKKEIEINEAAEKKLEEFKKAKELLKTPDEVADLPFHEEADDQESKTEEKKQNDTVIEIEEIVQVEKAEYVLVSSDSSPEVLKRQVMDTVDLLDTEPDSDKEDEIEEHKANNLNADADEKAKLIEHLLESSKDLCEITGKIDELKKQNEENIKLENESISQSNVEYAENTTVINSKEIIDLKTESNIKEGNKSNEETNQTVNDVTFKDTNESTASYKEDSICEKSTKHSETEIMPKTCTKVSSSKSICREPEDPHLNVAYKDDSKSLSKDQSMSKEPIKDFEIKKNVEDNEKVNKLDSLSQEKINGQLDTVNQLESETFNEVRSISEKHIKDSETEKITKPNEKSSRSNSVCQEQRKSLTISTDKSELTSSKVGSICEDLIKDTETEKIIKSSRSSSVFQEQENTHYIVTDKNESKASSKAGSISDDQVINSEIEQSTKEITISDVADKQESKTSSKAGSICEEQVIESEIELSSKEIKIAGVATKQELKILNKEETACEEQLKESETKTITKDYSKSSRSSIDCQEQGSAQPIITDENELKASRKTESTNEEIVKNLETEHTTKKITISNVADKLEFPTSSKTDSVNEGLIKDSETKKLTKVSESNSACQDQELVRAVIAETQASEASSKERSICEEQIKKFETETITKLNEKSSKMSFDSPEQEITHQIIDDKNDSKVSSYVGSVCEEQIKDSLSETIIKENRSNSLCQGKETENSIDVNKNESKKSSKAGTICDKVKDIAVEHNAIDITKSDIAYKNETKTYDKAGSVSEEQLKGSETKTTTKDCAKSSKSSSVYQEQINEQLEAMDHLDLKDSSKTGSICEKQIKNSEIDTIKKQNVESSRSNSICQEQENLHPISTDKNELTSNKARSICEDSNKEPENEKITKSSRSSSVCQEQENVHSAVIDTQSSKTSSKEGSISEDPKIESEIDHATKEITIPDVEDKLESKVSSKAESVNEEPINGSEMETTTKANRSSSVCQQQENVHSAVIDIQSSKTSSKEGSISEDPKIESEIDHATKEITIPDVEDKLESKVSSKAESVNEEPINGSEMETTTKASRSSSVCQQQENVHSAVIDIQSSKTSSKEGSISEDPKIESEIDHATKEITIPDVEDKLESKVSSKAESVNEEPINGSEMETTTKASRSSSVCQQQENVHSALIDIQSSKTSSKEGSISEDPKIESEIDHATKEITIPDVEDKLESKVSSKAESVNEEPIKDSENETTIKASRSSSINLEHENVHSAVIDTQSSKASSKEGSISEDPKVESKIHHATKEITIPGVDDKKESKVSSKAESVNEEPINGSEMETTTKASRSSSIYLEHENVHSAVIDTQSSKASSKEGSISEDPKVESKIDHATKEITIPDVEDKLESKVSSKAESVNEEPINGSEMETTTKASRSSSVCQQQENVHSALIDIQSSKTSSKEGSISEDPKIESEIDHATKEITIPDVEDKLESKVSSKAESVNEEPIKDSENETTIKASRSSSINLEHENVHSAVIDTQSSKASSKEGSISEDPKVESKIDHATKEITIPGVDDKKESKVSSKAESLNEEPINGSEMETTTKASRSSSIYLEQENIHSAVIDTQLSKTSSKEGSISEDPKIESEKDHATEEITIPDVEDKLESKVSSKAESVNEEPIKDSEMETTITASRSSSIYLEQENLHSAVIDTQSSKASSKEGSISEDTKVESKIDHATKEITIPDVDDKQESKVSSKAESVNEEPIIGSEMETTTKASRSSSIYLEQENLHSAVIDTQSSKASSKEGSISEDTKVESKIDHATKEITIPDVDDKQESKVSSKAESVNEEPINGSEMETTTKASRSSSIYQEQENVHSAVVDTQSTKTSSKEGSISEDPKVESKIDHATKEITIPDVDDKQESKVSSKAESVNEEPINGSERETTTKASRSSSIYQEQENVHSAVVNTQSSKASSKEKSISEDPKVESEIDHATKEITIPDVDDKQESKVSSKAESVNEEPTNDSEMETTIKTSRSSSICQEQENVHSAVIDTQSSKASSKKGSISEDPKIESKIDHATKEITIPDVEDELESKVSSKAESVNEEPIKDSEMETTIKASRSSSIYQEQENVHSAVIDTQSSKASSKEGSISEDPKIESKIDYATKEITIPDVEDELESKVSSKAESVNEEPIKDSEMETTIKASRSSSIYQEQENVHSAVVNTQSSKASSKEGSIHEDTKIESNIRQANKEITILDVASKVEDKILIKACSLNEEPINFSESEKITKGSRSSSICQEQENVHSAVIDTQSSKASSKEGSMCEEQVIDSENKTKECEQSSGLNALCQEQKTSNSSSISSETRKLSSHGNDVISSSSSENDNSLSNVKEARIEESKSLGTIGSLREEIAKFLTEDDKKTSKILKSEQSNGNQSKSADLKSNSEESKVISETVLKNSNTLISNDNKCMLANICDSNENGVNESLKQSNKVKINDCYDNYIHNNKEDSLPIANIIGSNITTSNISTLLIEENDKTGKMNVAQLVDKNVDDESLTKHTVITTNESDGLKTIPITTSDECISKSSTALIEDVIKTCDEKHIKCEDDNNSTVTGMSVKQSLGVTLNSEDLGLTKDIVMQLKRDVHEALHQFSSEDDRPFTPHSESSMSRSTMNIDDDDYDDVKNETDDDMPGSPMSTGPSLMPIQLDNRNIEMDLDFNKALQEHRLTRGEDLTTIEKNGNHVTEIKTTEHDNINQNQGTSSDTVQSWGKPLGLPPVQNLNNNGFDPIRDWGKPLGLPSPTQPVHELSEPQNMSSKTTPKKHVKKSVDNKPIINVIDKDAQNRIRRSESPSKLRSRSSSRMSRLNPIYLDLIYVPHHGNSKYVSADFFKRIRARNYVFSGTDPSKEVLNALIEGKQTWEDKDLEVTIIPTYDTDMLGQWVSENEELLAKLKIDLSPSASRCTIKLQDHNTSCSAYRLEF